MRIINPSIHIMDPFTPFKLLMVENCARTCYLSEPKYKTPEETDSFLNRLVNTGHHSQLEHVGMTVKIVCDRGVTHELVRHRHCSFSQESTRYCNYSKMKFGNEITVIDPLFFKNDNERYDAWCEAMLYSEKVYLELLEMGATAQEARSVLPNSLKTTITVTANLREWMHIFTLRCAKEAHPQMRQVMIPLLKSCVTSSSMTGAWSVFDAIYNKTCQDVPSNSFSEVSVTYAENRA